MRVTLSRRASLIAVAISIAPLLAAGEAAAHGLGTSELHLRVDGSRVDGEWTVQLPDARRAASLDPRTDGEAGWQELRGREASLRAYLAARISLTADGAGCATAVLPAPPVWQPESKHVVLRFVSTCPVEPRRIGIACDLLFDLDARHRAYYAVEDARGTHAGVFRADRRAATIEVRQLRRAADFIEFAREGIVHIGTGLDHLLFLLALLLPAPLLREAGRWSPRAGVASAVREVVKVVTAFTLAHSLTLALSFLGWLSPSARWVEVAIAISVFAAAWNNLRPFLPGRAWAMALAFGLVHGLGFAGALRNLSLPIRARGFALAAFNVGVELGQLAIVAPLLPLLYAASRRRWYPRMVMGAGSLAIAWLAALWVIERGFGVPLTGGLGR